MTSATRSVTGGWLKSPTRRSRRLGDPRRLGTPPTDVEHARRAVDADHGDPASGDGHGDSAGADAELDDGPGGTPARPAAFRASST